MQKSNVDVANRIRIEGVLGLVDDPTTAADKLVGGWRKTKIDPVHVGGKTVLRYTKFVKLDDPAVDNVAVYYGSNNPGFDTMKRINRTGSTTNEYMLSEYRMSQEGAKTQMDVVGKYEKTVALLRRTLWYNTCARL